MSSRSRRVAADQKTQGVRPQAAAQSADIIASCARLAVLKSLAALRPPHRRTPPPYHSLAAPCGSAHGGRLWTRQQARQAARTGGRAQAQKSRTRYLTRAGTWNADATASPHRTSTRACDAPIRAAISSVRISAATGGFRQWFSCQKLTKPLRPALRRTDAEAGEQLKVQGGWSSGDSAARARRSAAVASGSAL